MKKSLFKKFNGLEYIQNFSSNIVFGILLFAMIIYWLVYLFLMDKYLSKIGQISTILQIYSYFLFFVHDGL